MPSHDLTTRTVPIADLRPHPRNARNGDTDAIATSLRVNGQYRPIVTASDGTILAGNHTYMAAMELGWDSIAVVTLDLDPDSADAYRVMLADNRTADLGTYDDSLLLHLLAALDDDLLGTGYTESDLLDLLPDDTPLDLDDDEPLPLVPLPLLVRRDTQAAWRRHRAGYPDDTTALTELLP